MNFTFLLCELSCFICFWHSLHATKWKGTFFSVSAGVNVDGTLISEVTDASVSEFSCRILCLRTSDCIAFSLIQTTGLWACNLYSFIQKFVFQPTASLYLIGDQPTSIQVPDGVDAVLHEGLAFMVLPGTSVDWKTAYARCFEYDGFRTTMPKTQMQYDYLRFLNAALRSNIALDLHVKTTGIYFGDGTPYENSEISGQTIIQNNLPLPAVAVFLMYNHGGLNDMAYTNPWASVSVCESNIFGNFTMY